MKGKYLYGIIKNTKDTSEVAQRDSSDGGGKKRGLSTVAYRDLAAVIREAEYKDYKSLAKEETIKELIAHQQQIERMMEEVAYVLPVKFGTILRDEEEVRSVLEKAYSFLLENLGKIESKIELDLVCFWNEKKAGDMAYQESERVRDAYKKGIDKIALGKLVSQYLENKKKKISSQILRVLKKLVVENCRHPLADVNMLLNQAFLVEKKNEERFNHALNWLNSCFADLINFRLVGPLPPYSFATVVIDALDKEEVEKAKKLLNLNGSTESTLSKVEGLTTGGEINKNLIKKAYDKLAFKHHPDHGGDPVKFEQLTKNYQLLRKYANQGLIGVYLYNWDNENLNLHPDYPYGS